MLEQSISKLQELRKTEDVGMAYVEMGKLQLLVGNLDEWEDTMNEVSEMKMGENDYESAYRIIMDVRAHTHQALTERGIVL